MSILKVKNECVGCGACVDVCPTKCLELKHNEFGFYTPQLQTEKCVDCLKCNNVCPVLNVNLEKRQSLHFYGYNKNINERLTSSSGGIFSALANYVISKGGVVYGAKYSDDFKNIVMSSTEECDLESLKGSKYGQTYSNGLYQKIQKNLKENKLVMLVGTPCQISAARRIFKDNENLILVDFLCGGITPNSAFTDYVNFLEKKYKSKIKSINMRDKTKGWSSPHIKVVFENGKTYLRRYQLDLYNFYYYSPLLKSDQCTHCSFVKHNDADITIADFWGYKKLKINNDDKGLSFISVFTNKAQKILNEISSNLELTTLNKEDVLDFFNDKKVSLENLKLREKLLNEVKDSSFIQMAKNNFFKGGKLFAYLRLIKRKVFKK